MKKFDLVIPQNRSFTVIEEYRNLVNSFDCIRRDQVDDYVNKTLDELIKFVYENNNYYRNNLVQAGYNKEEEINKETFEKIPFLTKNKLCEDSKLILSVPIEEVAQVHISTGTSGANNIYMMYTKSDLYGAELVPKCVKLTNATSQDIVTIALPYEMSSCGQAFQRVMQFIYNAAVLPVGKGSVYSEPDKTVTMMKDMKSNFLITSPSYSIELLKAAKLLNINTTKDIQLKTIFLTGEGCSDAFRKKIEKAWNCKCKFYYGSLEAGGVGVECDANDGYHIVESHIYVEIIDPVNENVLPDGEIGEIVITTLLKEGTPLIRYRTQDIGYIENKGCKCGIPLKKLHLRGRTIDQICVKDKKFSPIYLEEILMRIPGVSNDYRFVIYKDYIEVIVEIDKEFNNITTLQQDIENKMQSASGITMKATLVDEIPYLGKKVRRVQYAD